MKLPPQHEEAIRSARVLVSEFGMRPHINIYTYQLKLILGAFELAGMEAAMLWFRCDELEVENRKLRLELAKR